jgi:hypothetical protein
MPDVVATNSTASWFPSAMLPLEEAVLRLTGSHELRQCLGQAAQETMTRYT